LPATQNNSNSAGASVNLVLAIGLVLSIAIGAVAAYSAYQVGYSQSEADFALQLAEKDKEIAAARAAAEKAARSKSRSGREPPPPVKKTSLGATDLGISSLTMLNASQQELVMGVLNTAVGPCDPCIASGLSAAACTKAKPICENMPRLVERAARLAAEGKDAAAITAAISYGAGWARIDLTGSPSEGSDDAPVTIVEYSEFQCPFCRRAQATMAQVHETYGDKVRFVFKHYPLAKHKQARPAAIASMAAGRQGLFWEYKAALFERQKDLRTEGVFEEIAGEVGLDIARWKADMEDPAIEAQIKTDVTQAKKVGVTGTPCFFVNGYKLKGAKPFEAFEDVIERELAD